MSIKTNYFIPVGYALTLTSDAFTSGVYTRQGDPGGTRYTPATLAVSTTVVIGPFNEPRNYLFEGDGNDLTTSTDYSGSVTASDDAAIALLAPIASPTFTGTVTLPKVLITKAGDTEALNAVTASGSAGVITTSALTTTAGGTYVITWTNTYIASTSVILLTHIGGTNTKDIIFKVVPGTGTATLTIFNVDLLAALDGTVKIAYMVI